MAEEKSVPKSQESLSDSEDAIRRKRWEHAFAGWIPDWDEVRFPIVVRSNTYLSSVEKLRKVACLPQSSPLSSTPAVCESTGEEITICDLGREDIAHIKDVPVWEETVVRIHGEKTVALRPDAARLSRHLEDLKKREKILQDERYRLALEKRLRIMKEVRKEIMAARAKDLSMME